ncbi:MAG: hypothetical protein ACQGVK_22285 [Myxococcota bacterium]
MAVAKAIRDSYENHGWDVVGTEVPWSGGFVDLVIRQGSTVQFVECKRSLDDEWIFLVDNNQARPTERCRLEWFNGHAQAEPERFIPGLRYHRLFTSEFRVSPGSLESEYCVTTKKKSPTQTLEPTCSELLNALHELGDICGDSHEFPLEHLIPTIVTSAPVLTCAFEPTAQMLATGEIENATTIPARLVRFRKSFVNYRSDQFADSPVGLRSLREDRERTVLVIHAESLIDVLQGMTAPRYDRHGATPPEFADPPRRR